MKVKITVIIATYNAEKYLSRCLDSIRLQGTKDLQVLVKDGGSIDRTQKILGEYSDCIDKVIFGSDDGIYDAWNKALPFVKGEWVFFLGADDWLVSGAVDIFKAELSGIPSDMMYFLCDVYRYQGEDMVSKSRNSIDSLFKKMPFKMPVDHQGVFHSSKLFNDKAFEAGFKIAGDYEFLLKTLTRSNVMKSDEVFANALLGGVGDQLDTLNMVREFRTAQKLNGKKPDIRWCVLYGKALIKKVFIRTLGEGGAYKLVLRFRSFLGLIA